MLKSMVIKVMTIENISLIIPCFLNLDTEKCLVVTNQASILLKYAAALLIPAVVTAAATPGAVGQQVPDRYKDDCADERSNEWNGGSRGNVDIADTGERNNLRHQPDAYQARDDRADESEREPPADDNFRDEANDGGDDEVYDETGSNRPGIITNLNSDSICENGAAEQEVEHETSFNGL